jgi:predicted signal transduction protein with EAL and GGDEF domain
MLPSRRGEAIVHSIIDLSHSLGMSAIAEGIEDAATLARLTELGCDVGQGFHMSRPVPAAELEEWVEASWWGTSRVQNPEARTENWATDGGRVEPGPESSGTTSC